MTKLAHSTIFAGLLTLAVAGAAHAQTKAPDDATTAEAKQRFNEGIKFADQGDHEAARLKFGQAWALLKSPAILYNLARSEQLSNHPLEALEHYRLFAKMAATDPKINDQQKQRAAENQAQLTKKIAEIEIDALAGARVTIDGKPVDWTTNADPFPVLPGSHVVEATAEGKTNSVTIDCVAGAVTKASLKESAAPAPAPPPAAPAPSPVVSEPPKEPTPSFWTTGRAVGAGVVGVGVVGVALGVVFQLKASSTSDDATADRAKLPKTTDACNPPATADKATCADLHTKASDLTSQQNLRTAFFIGGGALVVGGAVLFLVSPPKHESTQGLRFLPYASADGAGLTVLGRY